MESNEPDRLESGIIYSGVNADGEEQVEVVLVEETYIDADVDVDVDQEGGVRDAVSDAASAVGDTASDAASAVGDAASDAASAVSDAASGAATAVKEATPSRQQIKAGASRIGHLAQESPFALAITGACVGFLAGMLAPTTQVDEKLAPYAEQVVDKAREAGQSAVEQGKQAVQEAGPVVGAALKG